MNLWKKTPKFAVPALLLFMALVLVGVHSSATSSPPSSSSPSTVSKSPQDQAVTVVYYFHGNMRCSSCRKIEAYTVEAIQSGFAAALKNGALELKVVNVEESGNDHYVRDFQLYTRSVVVEKRSGDKGQEWKNLDKVWRLTRDKAAFINYVQQETRAMMEGARS
jgi:hypothetical protein